MSLRQGQTRLQRIRERRVLRVGYNPTRLPFSYTNVNGEIVGFDIDMVNRLAGDLGVALELVPMQFGTVAQQLADDHFDIAISGLEATIGRAEEMSLSTPYLDLSLAVVVLDHRKKEFETIDSIRRIDNLKVAVLEGSFYVERLRYVLPRVGIEAEIIEIARERDYFSGQIEADALMTSAEAASAFTLFYPDYHVEIPLRPPVKVATVFGAAKDANELEAFLTAWIELRKRDRTIEFLYNHWILGADARRYKPRWSIARDVLGWMQ
ncbi:MAG: ABC transporter substrate-binding protein [Acidobacteriota bacterium]